MFEDSSYRKNNDKLKQEPILQPIKGSISNLRDNKAAVLDETNGEMIKEGGTYLREIIHELVKRIWIEEKMLTK